MNEIQRLYIRDGLTESEKQFAGVAFDRGVDRIGFARIKSRGDAALFGGHDTRAMKRKLGVSDKKPLADVLPSVTLAAKNLATTMTTYNIEEQDLRGVMPIEREHVDNNASVRRTLTDRGIYPESLQADEDTKKVARRVRADERKLKEEAKGFPRLDIPDGYDDEGIVF